MAKHILVDRAAIGGLFQGFSIYRDNVSPVRAYQMSIKLTQRHFGVGELELRHSCDGIVTMARAVKCTAFHWPHLHLIDSDFGAKLTHVTLQFSAGQER